MRVKRYVVDSMPDAMQKIRTDLGKDAVILNTKDIKVGGFLGMFGRKCIEVIAAIDTNASPQASKPAGRTPTAVMSAADSGHAAVLAAVKPPPAAPAPAPVTAPAPAHAKAHAAASASGAASDESLIQEVRQMKSLLQQMTKDSGMPMIPAELAAIESRLLEQEIHPELVVSLLTEARSQLDQAFEDWTAADAITVVRELLLRLLRSAKAKPIQNSTKIVHFVGPTGVGKTTTIAKLAAEQVLKFNRKVGFITSDTYRIAAIEQLRTYANILNVPLEVVFSSSEMTRALHQFADYDVVFMDTAGRNFRNEMNVSELNALLKASGQCETYLVLSLTSKYRDMKTITENFSKFKLDKLLFTKLDETETIGGIVNLVHDFDLRGSYVTNGQNVPDDIEILQEERIVDLILGGVHHE